LLGHFRHEVGHHYWDVLVRNRNKFDACRAVFGDDTIDYGEALKRHYEHGSPQSWEEQFISQYATTHPWEDFAETWAHYLHIVDMLEMIAASGMSVRPIVDKMGDHSANIEFDSYFANSIEQILEAWLPKATAAEGLLPIHHILYCLNHCAASSTRFLCDCESVQIRVRSIPSRFSICTTASRRS
jgi:hypothetical protein